MRGNLIWGIYAFVTSKAGLTKEVVFHERGLSKEVLLYTRLILNHISIIIYNYCYYHDIIEGFTIYIQTSLITHHTPSVLDETADS